MGNGDLGRMASLAHCFLALKSRFSIFLAFCFSGVVHD